MPVQEIAQRTAGMFGCHISLACQKALINRICRANLAYGLRVSGV